MKFLKGLWQDGDPIDQPEGALRDSKNTLYTKREGSICSEEGTSSKDSVPYPIIGSTGIYDGREILFSTDGNNSEVGVFDGETYTTVLNESQLNFSQSDPIEAVSIINNRDNIIVFWTDGNNPPRYYNITKAPAVDNIKELNLFPSVDSVPELELSRVNAVGGSLLTGAYYFAIRMISEDGSVTPYMTVTPPIYINDDNDVSNHDGYDGAPAGTQSTKSISLNIDNLDTNYAEYQIAAIRKENNSITEVVQLEENTIGGEEANFLYTGDEDGTDISLDEIIINTASYASAETIVEIDGTLYLGNLTREEDVEYQKFANNIEVEAIEKEVEDGSGLFGRGHYGNPIISFYDKSFKAGEVYAFYISFVLDNGTETPAYHIPGREAEGTELNSVSNSNLLNIDGVNSSNKNYEFISDAGSNNMAYWENKSETYPSAVEDEEGRWEVWDVDSNGDPVNTGTTLHGEPVRHHHFPDYSNGFRFFEGTDNNPNGKTLGVEFSNIKIPKDIINRVKGVKIYYAERTNQDKRILDQGFVRTGEPRTILDRGDEENSAWVPLKGDSISEADFLTFNCFNSIRTKQNLGSVSYIKMIAQTYGDSEPGVGDDDDDVFYDQTMNYDTVPLSNRFRAILDGTAKTYMDENSYIESSGSSFSFDIDNRQGEESIGVELEESLPVSLSTAVGAENISTGYIGELCSVKSDLYSPFYQQNLVWTGFMETDIDRFDARVSDTDSSTKAQGSIEITSGAGTVNDVSPTAEVTITNGQDEGSSGTVSVQYKDETLLIDISAGSTIDEVGSQMVTAIVNDPDIGLTAEYSSEVLTLTSEIAGEADNGEEVTFGLLSPVTVTFSDMTIEMSGGDEIDDFHVDIGGESFVIDVDNSESASSIATELHNKINNNSTKYDSSLSSNTLTITAKDFGSEYNTLIYTDIGDTGITVSKNHITGGSKVEAPQFTTEPVFGGDIFISAYGTRRTVRDEFYYPGSGLPADEINAHYRHLIYCVVESTDNIKLRYEGEGQNEYYPKSSIVDVLKFEDDTDDYIGNFMGYNIDYSSTANIKVGFPQDPVESNIERLPTRIIRSAGPASDLIVDEGLRTFLENDYMDLTRTRGPLVKLSVQHNTLIPHMQRSLIRTKGREDLAVGDIRAFVGAGDIFSVPPDEIISTRNGFAGLQDPQSAITTPYGYFFPDREAGKVYLVSDSPQEISANGLRNFFYDELTSISSDGQLISAYDNKWNRIILTKKGEWTVSYYPTLEIWGSFHDYDPDYYFSSLNTFYAVNNNSIHKHNEEGNPCSFYGSQEDMMVEFVENRSPAQSKLFMNIQFMTSVEDPSGEEYFKETFDQFRIYNSFQDSGLQNIIYFTQTDGNARNVEGTWKINKFRDMLVDGSIDQSKPWQDQSKFIGKYVRVKLIFNNSDNKSLYLHNAMTGAKQSIR